MEVNRGSRVGFVKYTPSLAFLLLHNQDSFLSVFNIFLIRGKNRWISIGTVIRPITVATPIFPPSMMPAIIAVMSHRKVARGTGQRCRRSAASESAVIPSGPSAAAAASEIPPANVTSPITKANKFPLKDKLSGAIAAPKLITGPISSSEFTCQDPMVLAPTSRPSHKTTR